MSGDSKKLYSLLFSINESADRTLFEAKYARKDSDRRELLYKCYELRAKAEVMKGIFWISVKDEHGPWDKESVGVRKGFLVVWTEEKEQPRSFVDFLRGF